jgi:hypothetical protein
MTDDEIRAEMTCRHLLLQPKREIPRAESLSRSGAGYGPHGDRSVVEGRYHLHPAAGRVRFPGGDPGRLLPTCLAGRWIAPWKIRSR